jgi:hypothetical protein
MQFRASSAYSILTGSDGLTEKQEIRLAELLSKIKLTEKQAEERDELVKKRDSEPELPEGAKTYIEELVDREVYQYDPPEIDTYETDKGTQVEQEAIDLLNAFWFTNYQKAEVELSSDNYRGHPDIVDEENLLVPDIKASYNKKTFPKTSKAGENLLYIWQIKIYLYMLRKMTGKDWRKGMIVYVLVNTPVDLIKQSDNYTLHMMDELELRLRFTFVDVWLSDKDITFIERRGEMANKYAEKYRNTLKQKNVSS